MNRRRVFVLFAIIIFVGWFFSSLFYSTTDEWWTLYYSEQAVYTDVFIANILWMKVVVAAFIVLLASLILYFISNKVFPEK